MGQTSLLAISTPDDETNYYSQLFEVKTKTGELMFHTMSVGLSCDICVLQNNPHCDHKVRNFPSWHSQAGQEKAEAILSSRPEQANRELFGVITSSREYLFKKYVPSLHARSLYVFQHSVNVIHIGIDPAGGSKSSDYSIASIAMEEDEVVILGLDASSSYLHNDIMLMLYDHIMGLRALPQYSQAVLVFYIEANMSWLAVNHLQNYFNQSQFGRVQIVSRDPKNLGRAGVWTGPQEKEMMAKDLVQIMSDGKLHFAQDLVSDNPERNIMKLFGQLDYFSRIVIPPSDESKGEPKIVYSGKGVGRKDDLVLSLMLAITHAKLTRLDPSFVETCITNGWRY